MKWTKLAAVAVIIIAVAAATWYYVVVSYESELGTTNVVFADMSDSISNSQSNNQLVSLYFDKEAEDLLWSSVSVSLVIDNSSSDCTFGVQSNSSHQGGKVQSKLGADGATFTTQVDATDTESFTFVDIANQTESNESDYWLKFSSTDIYMSSGMKWTFIGDKEFSEIESLPEQLSNDTENRLEWYEYDISVHRVNPNDGVYVFEKDDVSFKIKFLTYYNSNDESRFPTMQIAALGNSTFPALDNPNLVIPSPCKILTDDSESDYWNSGERIVLVENGVNLCDGVCTISLNVKFETIDVELKESELVIGSDD